VNEEEDIDDGRFPATSATLLSESTLSFKIVSMLTAPIVADNS